MEEDMNRNQMGKMVKTAAVGGFFLLSIISESFGTKYYVNITTGSDNNSGKSTKLAWKTLHHASAYYYSPGDSLLLSRGCQWYDSLVDNSNGSSTKPFYIGPYGTGAQPIINDTADTVMGGYGIKLFAPWAVIESLTVKNGHDGGIFI